MKQFTVALLVLANCLTYGAFAQGTFALWCRGPFAIASQTGNSLHLTFERNTTSAGYRGKNLLSGRCAWADRPLYASEPNSLFALTLMTASSNVQTQITTAAAYTVSAQALIYAATRSDYVFMVGVSNAGTSLKNPDQQIFIHPFLP